MPTPLTATDLTIVNQALTGWLGEDEVENLTADTTKRAKIMRLNYESVSESTQIRTAWRFNTLKAALNKLLTVPENRWSAAWQLPNDNLKVLTTWPPGNYELQDGKLLSNNTDEIEIDYQRKVEEAFWPAWFQRYVVIRLAIRVCRGITGEFPDQTMKDELKAARDDAMFQDAQQQPNQTRMPNEFIDARF